MSRPPAPDATPSPGVRRLQMADIARLAGVSIATVSRALHGSELISAATRKRICDLAQSLHYSIDVRARNLRLDAQRSVAVVLTQDARQPLAPDPFAESLLPALAGALQERDLGVQLVRVDARGIEALAQLLGAGQAHGALVLGQWPRPAQLNELAARGDALVVWGAPRTQQLYCSVGCDNAGGARAAVRHLLAAGCRHVVFVGDVRDTVVAQRYEGYGQALAEAGLAAAAALWSDPADAQDESWSARLREPAIDGVFAADDTLAMAAIQTLRTLPRRVPEDVLVAGFGDAPAAACFHPPLTSVRQPAAAAVAALAEALAESIAGRRPACVQLPTELVVRASSQRPPRKPPARKRVLAGA